MRIPTAGPIASSEGAATGGSGTSSAVGGDISPARTCFAWFAARALSTRAVYRCVPSCPPWEVGAIVGGGGGATATSSGGEGTNGGAYNGVWDSHSASGAVSDAAASSLDVPRRRILWSLRLRLPAERTRASSEAAVFALPETAAAARLAGSCC